jgi:hypothetical protein
MADTFLGDDLFVAKKTIPVEERVDNAINRIHKLTATYRATIGQSVRGGNTFGKRGGGRRGGSNNNYNNYSGGMQQQYNMQSDYSNDFRPGSQPTYGRFNGNGNFDCNNGGKRGNRVGTCFICGSTGHQAKQCPKAG